MPSPAFPRSLRGTLSLGVASAVAFAVACGAGAKLPPTPSATPSASTFAADASVVDAGGPRSCRTIEECMASAEEERKKAEDGSDLEAAREAHRARATALHRRACDLGGAEGCARVAEAYASGRGVAASAVCSFRFEERACALGGIEPCDTVARRLRYGGPGIPKDLARAATFEEKACNAGHVAACQSLAYALASGDGVAKDEARAARLFERACDAASRDPGNFDRRACVPFADRLLEGRWVPKDEPRAAAYYEAACLGGAFEVCFALAKLVASGRGVTKDPARAGDLLESACANAFGVGCDEGEEMFRTGRGVPRDLARAKRFEGYSVQWWANGCSMHGLVESCERVTRYYARVATSANATNPNVEMACARGVADACRLAARGRAPAESKRLLARARDLADPTRTKAMLERECDADVASDCYLLGEAYLTGNATWNVPKDVARGRALVRKSCGPNGDSLSAECRAAGALDDAQEPPATVSCDATAE